MPKTIRISDIQTDHILFYVPEFRDECYQFCKKRNIDCLPCFDDSTQFFQRDDKTRGFIKQSVVQERCVDGSTNIFNPEILGLFRTNHLLFVYVHGDLTGVVHFSDYNKSVVSSYLYELLFTYEKALRELLERNNLKNADMLSYFEEKKTISLTKSEREKYGSKVGNYKKREPEFRGLPPFQFFNLDDLIGLAQFSKTISLNDSTVRLRNHVMHAHEFVNRDDIMTDDLIYKFTTFEEIFSLVIGLQTDHNRVLNRLAFIR